jgi:DNA uptake protein ComE-like DNA-binding protein
MGLQKLIRNTFGFSRSQTNGFVIFLPLVAFALFSQPVYHWWVSNRPSDFSRERAVLDSLSRQWELQKKEKNVIPLEKEIPIALFKFDPNTISSDELTALGFSKRTSSSLLRYREKGGTFRIKSDVRKLYGMDSLFFETLVPFIQLPEKIEYAKNENNFTPAKKSKEPFDLNEADTTQLKSINGIGSKLASRIVKYRGKLGGFISKDQLQEVYGLDTAVVRKLRDASYIIENFAPQKISINHADEVTLAVHPYLNRKVANAIVAYRFQHGSFKSVAELNTIQLIDSEMYRRISPYVTLIEQPLTKK